MDSIKFSIVKRESVNRNPRTKKYKDIADTLKAMSKDEAMQINIPQGENPTIVRSCLYNGLRHAGVHIATSLDGDVLSIWIKD